MTNECIHPSGHLWSLPHEGTEQCLWCGIKKPAGDPADAGTVRVETGTSPRPATVAGAVPREAGTLEAAQPVAPVAESHPREARIGASRDGVWSAAPAASAVGTGALPPSLLRAVDAYQAAEWQEGAS
jgi:hypothetical protein